MTGARGPRLVLGSGDWVRVGVRVKVQAVLQLPRYLLQRQQHELLSLGHVHEVLQHVPVCRLEQVTARVCVGEAPDAQTVGGVELTQQELAAGVTDPIQLQKAGGREQSLRGKMGERARGAGTEKWT